MKRTRWLIGLQLGLGLILAGLGHYFTAMQRTMYPLDGFFFYAIAAICFVFAWRTARHEKNAVWAALLDVWRGAWHEIRALLGDALDALRGSLPYISARAIVIAAVALNVMAAGVALVLPALTWLWAVAWAVTVIAVVVYLWPWPMSQHTAVNAEPRLSAEPVIDSGARANPVGLVSSIGLLLVGELLLASAGQSPGGVSPIAQALDGAFRLGLPGDGALIWLGVIALVSGFVIFALVTRHSALSDYPPLATSEVGSNGQRRWGLLLAAVAGVALWLFALKSIAANAGGSTATWLWLIALVVIGACWWQIDRVRGARLAVRLGRREAVLLSAALAVVFVVLAYQLGPIPNSLWGDEGAFFVNARDVARGTASVDVFGLGTYAEPAFTTIFQSWFISLLGANLTAWRLSSVIAAWLAAIPLYFLARATLGRRTAWISLAFYAISPWVLTYARMGYDAAQGMLPVVLSLAFTWLAVRRDSRFYVFLAGCAAGLSFFTPAAARIVVVLMPLWLVWMWITRRAGGMTIARQLATATVGLVVVAAPPIVFGMSRAPDVYVGKQFESSFNNILYARDFYPEDQLFEWYGPIAVGQQQIFYDPQFYAPLIGRGVIRTALAFQLPAIVHENYLIGSLADPFSILYMLGLAWSVMRLRRPDYAIWPAWLLLGGFLAGVLSAYPPRAALLLPIAPALVVLSALGLTAGVDVLASLIGSVPEQMKSASLIGVTLLLAVLGLREYFVEMPQRFPPNLDSAVFWEAQALQPGADITLIQPDGVPDNYMPWGLQQFDLGVNYHLLKKADLPAANLASMCPTGQCRFVYSGADRDSVYPYLAQAFGERATAEIRVADGLAQLVVYER